MQEPNRKEDLVFLQELYEAGKVKPVIDKSYPLRELPQALRYLEEGQALRKIVTTVEAHPAGQSSSIERPTRPASGTDGPFIW